MLSQNHADFANHNGGGLAFGPDGKLWASVGDGGGSNDDTTVGGVASAQSPNTLLGKVVRIDPNAAGAAPEILHRGLRNPWRFSFDRASNDLVIGDVGQDHREEINVAPAADGWLPGANWGWPCWEGTRVNAEAKPGPCDPPDDRLPSSELDHDIGAHSITGGVVDRDPGLPTLAGRYFYGDYSLPRLRTLMLNGTVASDDRAEDSLAMSHVVSFGQDACGRVLAVSVDGPVYRVVDGSPAACSPPPPATGGGGATGGNGPGGAPGAPTTCGLSMRAPERRSVAAALHRRVRVTVRVRARCAVTVAGRLRGHRVRGRTADLVAGQRIVVRLRLGAPARRSLKRRGRAILKVTVRAKPAGGATVLRRARITIRG